MESLSKKTERMKGISELTLEYRLIAKLGSGGMADVFLGLEQGDEGLGRLVAVKKIRENAVDFESTSALRMFIDEAKVIAALNHPHVVKVYGLTRRGKDLFLAMEYIEGETLSAILKALVKRGRRLPLPIAFKLIIDACEAVHHVHAATLPDGTKLNIIHRDIDPSNIMLDKSGHIKIIDFGVAKSQCQTELTTDGMFKGKISFMAPDVFQCPTIDHRVDIYALGLVLFALCTSKKPYAFGSQVSTYDAVHTILNGPTPLPTASDPSLPQGLDEIVARACHKDREQRYRDAEQMAQAVEKLARHHGGVAQTAEVKRWFNEEFQKRLKIRNDFVSEAVRSHLQKTAAAERDAGEEVSVSSLPSQRISEIEISSSASALSTSRIQVPANQPPLDVERNRRWRKRMTAALVTAAIIVVSGVSLAWWSHQKAPDSAETTSPEELASPLVREGEVEPQASNSWSEIADIAADTITASRPSSDDSKTDEPASPIAETTDPNENERPATPPAVSNAAGPTLKRRYNKKAPADNTDDGFVSGRFETQIISEYE